MVLSTSELITRLLLAALLGSTIGFEREWLLRAAGLRTHMLVCVGSTLIMIVSAYGFAGVLGAGHVELDPSRVAAQVVSGIGFLGAGTILLRNDVVRGLTTAASLWVVAAIGLAIGGGLYAAAVITTLLILAILTMLKPLEKRLVNTRRLVRRLVIHIDPSDISSSAVEEAIATRRIRMERSTLMAGRDKTRQRLEFVITAKSPDELGQLVSGLQARKGVLRLKLDEIRPI